jgi:hypothetical protein
MIMMLSPITPKYAPNRSDVAASVSPDASMTMTCTVLIPSSTIFFIASVCGVWVESEDNDRRAGSATGTNRSGAKDRVADAPASGNDWILATTRDVSLRIAIADDLGMCFGA